MHSRLSISIEQNDHGVMYFEMTDGVDVVRKASVKECLQQFGIYATEETIKEWAHIAANNNHAKNCKF